MFFNDNFLEFFFRELSFQLSFPDWQGKIMHNFEEFSLLSGTSTAYNKGQNRAI